MDKILSKQDGNVSVGMHQTHAPQLAHNPTEMMIHKIEDPRLTQDERASPS
jgi:hypothetical protein